MLKVGGLKGIVFHGNRVYSQEIQKFLTKF